MNRTDTVSGLPMITIPAGSFQMGHVYRHDPSLPDTVNAYYPDEQPVRRVSIESFRLGRTPVTQKQYADITGMTAFR